MQKSRKKFWIIFTCVCAGIIAFCGIFAYIARLKTVAVGFRTRLSQEETVLESGILEKVKLSGDFDYGDSLLFMDFEKNISNIEKSNPFVKVEQVIRHFPSTAKVYISERIAKYRVEDSTIKDRWYILDSDFKVLDVVIGEESIKAEDSYGNSSYYGKTIEIAAENFEISSYIGEFLIYRNEQGYFNTIASAVFSKIGSLSMVKSVKIEKIDGVVNFTLTMKNSGLNNDNGCKIVIVNDGKLTEKVVGGVASFLTATENENTVDLSNKTIIVKEINGQINIDSVSA